MMAQYNTIFSITAMTLCAALIASALYAVLVLISVLSALYIKSVASINEGAISGSCVSASGIRRINALTLAVLATIVKSTKACCASIMFGHMLVSRAAVWMSVITVLLAFVVADFLICSGATRGIAAVDSSLHCMLIAIAASALWLSNSYYSMMFTLDCINIIMLSFMFCTAADSSNKISSFYSKISGVSVFFWSAFAASMILLVTGLMLIATLGSASIRGSLVSAQLLTILGSEADSTAVATYSVFIIGLVIKAGVGPFFFWKRQLFASASTAFLAVYMFVYFSSVFVYIINILTAILFIMPAAVTYAIAAVLVIATAEIKLSIDNGSSLQGFFVISTLLNASLVFGAVVSLAIFSY